MFSFIINYFRRCKIPTKKEIADYYPGYLKSHTKPWTRRFHALGQLMTLVWAASVIFASTVAIWHLLLLVFTPFIVYFFAWPSHRLIEKNKPATFKVNPLLTKACDLVMLKDMITGKLPS